MWQSFDALVRSGEALEYAFVPEGGLARVTLGNRWIGYADPRTLTIHTWPYVATIMDDADMAARLHEQADRSLTIARCYFIGGAEGLIKIGYSADPAGRLAALQAGSPVELRLLATREGGEARESAYHRQFAKHRVRGEWFDRCPEIEAEIEMLNAYGSLRRPARSV